MCIAKRSIRSVMYSLVVLLIQEQLCTGKAT